jgi:hypothetical protein
MPRPHITSVSDCILKNDMATSLSAGEVAGLWVQGKHATNSETPKYNLLVFSSLSWFRPIGDWLGRRKSDWLNRRKATDLHCRCGLHGLA